MSKPVDLIVQTVLNSAAQRTEQVRRSPLVDLLRQAFGEDLLVDDVLAEDIARETLRRIALHASPEAVLAALARVGAPSSLDEITQRLQSVTDARAAERKRFTPPKSTATEPLPDSGKPAPASVTPEPAGYHEWRASQAESVKAEPATMVAPEPANDATAPAAAE